MAIRCLTWLTNAFSEKWENHEAALALYFGYYNFCRVRMTLGTTSAAKARLVFLPWSMEELLERAV